jgi:hypothetical protein
MTLTDAEIADGYVLACSCHPQGDLVLGLTSGAGRRNAVRQSYRQAELPPSIAPAPRKSAIASAPTKK